MRILICTKAFAPNVGGVETCVMLLAQGLTGRLAERRQARIAVVTHTAQGSFNDATLPFSVVRRPSLLNLWRLIRESDVVHLAGPLLLPLAMALIQRKPTVVEHHAYQSVCPNGSLLHLPSMSNCSGRFMAGQYIACVRCCAEASSWFKSVKAMLATFPRRWLCKRADANVAVSSHVKMRIQLSGCRVIYHGVSDIRAEASSGMASAARTLVSEVRRGDGRDSAARIAYVGRLVSEKGVGVLLDAANDLKKRGYRLLLSVIGEGPERAVLEARSEELGLGSDVEFLGVREGQALEEALRDALAIVVPSIGEEAAGLAAIEHMMRGGLVIASDVGALREMLGDGGLLFPVGRAAALADSLRQVLDNPRLVTEIGLRARQRARCWFAQERMVAQHLELFEELISRSASR